MERLTDVERMIITDGNDMFLYFWLEEQLKPASILDVGMMLKRAGGVSRQLKQKGIGADVRLDGIDLFPEIQCPVWETVYHHIYTAEEFFRQRKETCYELVYMMRIDWEWQEGAAAFLWGWLLEHAHCAVTDELPEQYRSYWSQGMIQNLTVEGTVYWLVNFKG